MTKYGRILTENRSGCKATGYVRKIGGISVFLRHQFLVSFPSHFARSLAAILTSNSLLIRAFCPKRQMVSIQDTESKKSVLPHRAL